MPESRPLRRSTLFDMQMQLWCLYLYKGQRMRKKEKEKGWPDLQQQILIFSL